MFIRTYVHIMYQNHRAWFGSALVAEQVSQSVTAELIFKLRSQRLGYCRADFQTKISAADTNTLNFIIT